MPRSSRWPCWIALDADMETREAYLRAAPWKNNDAEADPARRTGGRDGRGGGVHPHRLRQWLWQDFSAPTNTARIGRGGQGVTNIGTPDSNPDRNGPVVASFPVRHGKQLMLVTDQAKLIRLPIEFRHLTEGGFENHNGFSIIGRGSSGVRIFDVAKGETYRRRRAHRRGRRARERGRGSRGRGNGRTPRRW